MKHLFALIISIIIFTNYSHAEKVKYVYDGDTFTTTDNKKIRLLNLNTTETSKKNSKAEPFSIEAKKSLEKIIKNKNIKLVFDEEKKDKYKRYLAYVYLDDGTFVNEEMLSLGMAHLYTFPNNTSKFKQLLKAENKARELKKGIWASNRFKTIDANSEKPVEKFRFAKYQVAEGTITQIVKIKNKIYLNFGQNWRTDFTAEINTKYLKYFKKKNINPLTYYSDKPLRIRGILKPVNGALISITHPEQIEILN